jgi:hypothetical protein
MVAWRGKIVIRVDITEVGFKCFTILIDTSPHGSRGSLLIMTRQVVGFRAL